MKSDTTNPPPPTPPPFDNQPKKRCGIQTALGLQHKKIVIIGKSQLNPL